MQTQNLRGNTALHLAYETHAEEIYKYLEVCEWVVDIDTDIFIHILTHGKLAHIFMRNTDKIACSTCSNEMFLYAVVVILS